MGGSMGGFIIHLWYLVERGFQLKGNGQESLLCKHRACAPLLTFIVGQKAGTSYNMHCL